jgi:hypothetical protein
MTAPCPWPRIVCANAGSSGQLAGRLVSKELGGLPLSNARSGGQLDGGLKLVQTVKIEIFPGSLSLRHAALLSNMA